MKQTAVRHVWRPWIDRAKIDAENVGLIVLLADATGVSAQEEGREEFSMEGFHFILDIPTDFILVDVRQL